MRPLRLLAALAVLALPAGALAQSLARTQEVLVATTVTKLPLRPGRKGTLLENRGPNPIWCGFSSTIAVGKAHKVAASGGTFVYNGTESIWCVAETATQVTYDGSNPTTTGGTVVSEVP